MNCCDGDCHQGCDCPIRKDLEDEVENEIDMSFVPLIVVILCLSIVGSAIIWGS